MIIIRSVSRLSVIGLLFSAFGIVQPAYAEYRPEGRAFVVENGDARFTRALYGGPSAFRLETSDRPEFGLWMPGMGGNVTFSVTVDKQKLPLLEAADIVCRYTEAARVYVISDPLFRGGTITLTARASDEYEGALWKVDYDKMPASTRIGVRYGGASGKRFSRNGDLGVDPADAFALTPIPYMPTLSPSTTPRRRETVYRPSKDVSRREPFSKSIPLPRMPRCLMPNGR